MFKIQARKSSFTHVSKIFLWKCQCFMALCICIQLPIVTSNQRYRNSHNHDRIENDAALVVCGVDGTVYTLNAWTGARVGRFVSGPALVSSSTLGNDEDEDYDEDFQNENQEYGFDDDFQDHDLHYDSTMDLSNQINAYTFNQKSNKFEQSYHNENQRQTKRREQIVPGLDFNLYTLTYEDEEDYSNSQGTKRQTNKKKKNAQLNILPVNVMDVTESPVSTCTNTKTDDGDDGMECGIIMGEKKSTVFALDASTGQVVWMQRPSSSEMGFTSTLREDGGVTFSTSPQNKNRKGQRKRKNGTVLLQREDYFVRKIDTDSGEEWWNVTVSHFSALDFLSPFQQTTDEIVSTVTSSKQSNRYRRPSSTAATGNVKRTHLGNNLSSGLGAEAAPNQFNRLNLAGQPSVEKGSDSSHARDIINFDIDDEHQRESYFDKKSSVGRKNTKIEEVIEMRRDPFSSLDDIFLSFPSIAFGEDGTTITAVDSSTGKVLWTENIDSIVAAVYGVGKENRWVSVEVVDESDIIHEPEEEEKHCSNIQRLMSRFSEKVNDDSRFRAIDMSPVSNRNKIIPSPGYDSSIIPFSYKRNVNEIIPVLENSRQKELAWVAKHATTQFVKSTTQRTSSQMNAQKIHYNALKVSYPPLDLSNPYPEANSESESIDAVSQIVYQRKDGLFLRWRDILCIVLFIFGAAAGVRTKYLQQKKKWMNTPVISSVTAEMKGKSHSEHSDIPTLLLPRGNHSLPGPTSLARSVSLPQLKTSNGSAARSHEDSSTFKNFDRSLDHRQLRINKLSIDEESDNARVLNMNQTTEEKNNQDGASKIDAKYSSIDGVPLVRYSRYDSEFKELSALGKGGFGTVFNCINVMDSRGYAIKKIRIKSYIDPSGEPSKHLSAKLKRVLREVKILALLDHANIVRYYTAWLEIEKDKESDDQFCHEDEIGTTRGLRDRGLLSSEASSGKSFTFSKSGTISSIRTNFRSINTPKHNLVSGMKNNPLYLPGFDEESKASESFSNNDNSELNMVRSTSADLGFNWERSNSSILRENMNCNEGNEQSNNTDTSDTIKMATHLNESINESDISDSSDSCDSESDSDSDSSDDGSYSASCLDQSLTNEQFETNGNITSIPENEKVSEEKKKKIVKIQKHILYIQMQLCSQKTLADFLASPIARKNGDVSASLSSSECEDPDDCRIDLIFAIRIFSQIARGVKHVHSQGLIHRDLKPSNCFVDDTGVVKVGDFGLSRTAATSSEEDTVDPFTFKKESFLGEEQNNTAGIGTRSYASPEQMNGSDYDASTDVYSLGIILFELCYPMYTGMERYLVFKEIRRRVFPKQWDETVAQSHPSLHALMNAMLSDVPSERPSADEVADFIGALLAEYTVQSLDSLTSQKREGSLLLRVEADDVEGILPKTVKIIKDASPKVEIVQYGLRGQTSKAIMEFAVSVPTTEQLKNDKHYEDNGTLNNDVIENIFTALRKNSDIKLVRRVTEKHLGRGDSGESSHSK